MNKGLVLGISLSLGVLAYLGGAELASTLLNMHAIVAVGAGTLAVLFTKTPDAELKILLRKLPLLMGRS